MTAIACNDKSLGGGGGIGLDLRSLKLFFLFLLPVGYRDFSVGLNDLYAIFELAAPSPAATAFLDGHTADYFLKLDCQLRGFMTHDIVGTNLFLRK